MKAILIGGAVLVSAWVGDAGPGMAVPLPVAATPVAAPSPFLVPARHHHHRRWHRHRGYSRAGEYEFSEPNSAGLEGRTGEAPVYPVPDAGPVPPPTADRGRRAGTATPPSIRWADPGRRMR